jgi:hypothetical protein
MKNQFDGEEIEVGEEERKKLGGGGSGGYSRTRPRPLFFVNVFFLFFCRFLVMVFSRVFFCVF